MKLSEDTVLQKQSFNVSRSSELFPFSVLSVKGSSCQDILGFYSRTLIALRYRPPTTTSICFFSARDFLSRWPIARHDPPSKCLFPLEKRKRGFVGIKFRICRFNIYKFSCKHHFTIHYQYSLHHEIYIRLRTILYHITIRNHTNVFLQIQKCQF